MEITVFTGKQPEFLCTAAIRQAVFVEEQGFHNEFDELDNTSTHCLITVDHVPAATSRAYEKEKGHWIIGRVAVLPQYRKQQLGKAAVEAISQYCITQGATLLELSAQAQAEGFYARLGFTPTGETHMDEFCPHVTMIRKTGE